jgi:hypothetical protein
MAKKKIGPEFAVKSSNFELYKAFKVVAEDIGYVYNENFTPFSVIQQNYVDCLYFAKDWDELDEGTHAFSLSNVEDEDVPIFDLEKNFNDAVNHARAVFIAKIREENKKIVVAIETEDGEDYNILVDEKTGDIEMGGLKFSFYELRRIYDAALSTITDHLRD